MKPIALISPEYPPQHGGVGDYTACLAAALVRAGAGEVHVICSTGDAGADETYPGAGCAGAREAAAVRVHRAIPRWDWSASRSLEQLLREIGAGVAVIEYQTAAYGLHGAINTLPRWLRRAAANPPLVTTFHDLREPYLFRGAGRLRGAANRELMRGSRAVVVTNPVDFAALPPFAATKAWAIPIGSNLVPQLPPAWSRDAWRQAQGIATDTTLIAYFGFINSSKGLDTLIEAMSLLKGAAGRYCLLIVGGDVGQSDATNAATAAEINKQISDLGVGQSVRWTGYLPPAGVSAALLSCDMAVLPFRDGAGFRRGSLLAALSHRLPLITTQPPAAPALAGWPELRDGENALLAPPGAAPALAAAIRRVAADAALRARLSAGAAELAHWFGWDAIANRYMDLFTALSNHERR